MTTRSVADLITRVRVVLQDQDQDNYRYPTSDIVGYLNDSVLDVRKLRPDMFLGRYRVPTPQVPDTAPDFTAIPFPLPDSAFTAVVDYCAGRCEQRDDEFAVDGRANTFVNSFAQKLMGGA